MLKGGGLGTLGLMPDVFEQIRDLSRRGEWDAAAALAVAANRKAPNIDLEAAYVRLQHDAFASVATGDGPTNWPPSPPDLFAGSDSIPEVDAVDLDALLLSSALHHHGSLIVRGFMNQSRLEPLRSMIDDSFAAMAAWEADRDADLRPWFVPFEPSEGYSLGEWERLFVTYGGGVHAVDSPRAWFEMVEALHETRVGGVLEEYFGERPTLSAKKTTLRKAAPDGRNGWHQDGAFLGEHTRSVNIWTSLTDSGVDAPGIEVIHRRFEELLETGTEGAQFTWSVSPDLAVENGGRSSQRPAFEAGDALMFDEKTLHQTHVDAATMTKTRYAIESWFFAPSTYPSEQIPICF